MISEILDAVTADVSKKGVTQINIELGESLYRKTGLDLWMESEEIAGPGGFVASQQRSITFFRNGVEVNIKPKS